ncbi:MAG TPA: hypothetical protein VJ784_05685 [Pyrinomonadaceae bacterium]|nr:hypothetical protein [Pyrinomonadaceae bacterium]
MQRADNETPFNSMEDQWESVLDLYEDQPVLAFILAQNFQVMKDVLEAGPSGTVQVIQSFDDAIETLFPFSEYYKAGREFFDLAMKGTLRPAFDLTKFAEQARSDAERDEIN